MPPFTPYKYKLHELFIRKYGKFASDGKIMFAETNGHSLSTTKHDCALTIDDAEIIPMERLLQYARWFQTNALELRNHKTEQYANA